MFYIFSFYARGFVVGFGASGPSAVHSSLEAGFPGHHFKTGGVEYPAAGGYYKDTNGYAKRAAPLYYIVETEATAKVGTQVLDWYMNTVQVRLLLRVHVRRGTSILRIALCICLLFYQNFTVL